MSPFPSPSRPSTARKPHRRDSNLRKNLCRQSIAGRTAACLCLAAAALAGPVFTRNADAQVGYRNVTLARHNTELWMFTNQDGVITIQHAPQTTSGFAWAPTDSAGIPSNLLGRYVTRKDILDPSTWNPDVTIHGSGQQPVVTQEQDGQNLTVFAPVSMSIKTGFGQSTDATVPWMFQIQSNQIVGVASSIPDNAVSAAFTMKPNAPLFGAATLEDGSSLVAYDDTTGQVHINWTYDASPDKSKNFQTRWVGEFQPPSMLQGWDGGVTLAYARNRVEPNTVGTKPYLLWIALSGSNGIAVGCMRFGPGSTTLDSAKNADAPGIVSKFDWRLVTPEGYVYRSAENACPRIKLFVDPTGSVRLSYLGNSGPKNLLEYGYVGCVNGGPNGFVLDSGPKFSFPIKANQLMPHLADTPEVAFVYGTPSGGQADPQVDVNVSMVTFLVPSDTGGSQPEAPQSFESAFGKARCTKSTKPIPYNGLPGILVGYFEGPPPVPNENLREGDENHLAWTKPLATATFGTENEQDVDNTFKGTLGLVEESQGSAYGATVKTEGYLGIMLGGKTSTAASVMQTKSCLAQAVPTGNPSAKYRVDTEGLAFVLETAYLPYAYMMLDASGAVMKDAPAYLQLVPYGSPVINAYPFRYNPAGTGPGIIPGVLPSYVVDGVQLNNLMAASGLDLNVQTLSTDKNIIGDPMARNYISTSWTEAGTMEQEIGTVHANSFSAGIDAELKVTAGVEADIPLFKEELMVGIKATFSYERTISATNKTNLSSQCDAPRLPEGTPGKFTGYTYYTFLLKENNQYCRDLMDVLKNYQDADGSNRTLLARIAPNSVPWKITYAIPATTNADGTYGGMYEQVPDNTNGATTAAFAEAAPQIPDSLKQKGLTSVEEIARVHRALRPVSVPGALASPAAAKGIASLAAPLRTKARQLGPQEMADMDRYVAALRAHTYRSFRRKYPNWKPRTFPAPSTNAKSGPVSGAKPAAAPANRRSIGRQLKSISDSAASLRRP